MQGWYLPERATASHCERAKAELGRHSDCNWCPSLKPVLFPAEAESICRRCMHPGNDRLRHCGGKFGIQYLIEGRATANINLHGQLKLTLQAEPACSGPTRKLHHPCPDCGRHQRERLKVSLRKARTCETSFWRSCGRST